MLRRHCLLSIPLVVLLILAITVPTVFAGPGGSEDIKALFRQGNLMAQEAKLVSFGPRVAGGPVEKAAADWIAGQFTSYGLDVEVQSFPINYYEELSTPVVQEVAPVAKTFAPEVDFVTMSYSGSGNVTAAVQAVDVLMPPTGGSTSGCEASDFAGFVPGNIALMQRGTCNFSVKAANAEAAGAKGAIIYNEGNDPSRTGILNGTLGGPGITIPVVGTTFAIGQELFAAIPMGLVVHMQVETVSYPSTSQNVIGTLPGTDPNAGIAYVGGHYDSVSAGPGANDDASGTSAVLETAHVLATMGHRAKTTLKFIAFGAEETGLNGSYEYVVAHEQEITEKGIGMVNLDMIGYSADGKIGLGNINYGLPGTGTSVLKDFTQAKATAMGVGWFDFAAGENSDHTYFEQVGVPAVIFNAMDPWYHTSQDTLDKIQPAFFTGNGQLAAATLYDWAKNPPLREKKAAKMNKVQVYKDQVRAAD